jgi:hypothetical protein
VQFFAAFLVFLLIAPPSSRSAPTAPTEDAQAFARAAAAHGIDAQVRYLDAEAPLPPIDGKITPPPPPSPEQPASGEGPSDTIIIAICLALLLAAAWAALRFGGARAASFARAPDTGLRRRAAPPAPFQPPEALDLARIAAIPDRRAALEALWLAALARAAAAHDLTIARSWTARDALRRVPGAWPHHRALARIARAAELAHFGGRTVPEAKFHALLDAAAPIFAGRTT